MGENSLVAYYVRSTFESSFDWTCNLYNKLGINKGMGAKDVTTIQQSHKFKVKMLRSPCRILKNINFQQI